MLVTIKYTGAIVDSVRDGASICPVFEPTGCYIDTPVFKNGLEVDGKLVYGKSVYATNVGTYGTLEDFLKGLLPIHTAPIRLAYFEKAIEAAAAGSTDGVTFDVGDDYMEGLYWEQISRGLKGNGFEVTVDSELDELNAELESVLNGTDGKSDAAEGGSGAAEGGSGAAEETTAG